jgi:hypothetical protein
VYRRLHIASDAQNQTNSGAASHRPDHHGTAGRVFDAERCDDAHDFPAAVRSPFPRTASTEASRQSAGTRISVVGSQNRTASPPMTGDCGPARSLSCKAAMTGVRPAVVRSGATVTTARKAVAGRVLRGRGQVLLRCVHHDRLETRCFPGLPCFRASERQGCHSGKLLGHESR